MFHVIDGHHLDLRVPVSESLLAENTTFGLRQLVRVSNVDFSKLEPLNANGYM